MVMTYSDSCVRSLVQSVPISFVYVRPHTLKSTRSRYDRASLALLKNIYHYLHLICRQRHPNSIMSLLEIVSNTAN
jgi:hypothetical protein